METTSDPWRETHFEDWLENVSVEHGQAELKRRLMDHNPVNNDSARQELALYDGFRRRNFGIETHPTLIGTEKRPDFRITTALGTVLVEAVTAQESNAIMDQDRQLKHLIQQVNSITADRVIAAHPMTALPANLPAKPIRTFLSNELSSDWPTNSEDPRVYQTTHNGQSVEIAFYSMAATRTGQPINSPIGVYGYGEARQIEPWLRTRIALDNKASKYGQLQEPYVICVYPRSVFHDNETDIDALIGRPLMNIDSQGRVEWSNHFDGFFFQERDGVRRRTQVSAVAIFALRYFSEEFSVFSLRVYHNPFAQRPLSDQIFEGWPQLKITETSNTVNLAWIEPPGVPTPPPF